MCVVRCVYIIMYQVSVWPSFSFAFVKSLILMLKCLHLFKDLNFLYQSVRDVSDADKNRCFCLLLTHIDQMFTFKSIPYFHKAKALLSLTGIASRVWNIYKIIWINILWASIYNPNYNTVVKPKWTIRISWWIVMDTNRFRFFFHF